MVEGKNMLSFYLYREDPSPPPCTCSILFLATSPQHFHESHCTNMFCLLFWFITSSKLNSSSYTWNPFMIFMYKTKLQLSKCHHIYIIACKNKTYNPSQIVYELIGLRHDTFHQLYLPFFSRLTMFGTRCTPPLSICILS